MVVLLIMNNSGSVADVIGGDDRSDDRVKNCCCDNKIASTLDRLFLFFKCRHFFFFFMFVCQNGVMVPGVLSKDCGNCIRILKKVQDFNGIWTHDLKSRWSPEVFFRLLTQLDKFHSQLWGSFFIWFHFCSSHMIYFIYIYHIHLFHGNIWTRNWQAPNISGFIAQLVRAWHRYCKVMGSNPVEVLNFFQASYAIA